MLRLSNLVGCWLELVAISFRGITASASVGHSGGCLFVDGVAKVCAPVVMVLDGSYAAWRRAFSDMPVFKVAPVVLSIHIE